MPAPKVNSSFAQVATGSRTKVWVLTCLTTLRGISAPAASICHSFRFRGDFITRVTLRTLLRIFGCVQTRFGFGSRILTRPRGNSLWLPRAPFPLGLSNGRSTRNLRFLGTLWTLGTSTLALPIFPNGCPEGWLQGRSKSILSGKEIPWSKQTLFKNQKSRFVMNTLFFQPLSLAGRGSWGTKSFSFLSSPGVSPSANSISIGIVSTWTGGRRSYVKQSFLDLEHISYISLYI